MTTQTPAVDRPLSTERGTMKKIATPVLALIALAAGLLATAAPAHAATDVTIRPGGFITALSDTRPTGHVDFLREGLRIYTEGATSTDKAAEYFVPNGAPASLPQQVSVEWTGTDAQPGAQIIFTATGSAGNNTATNRLVGEQVYSTNPAGQALTDWWYPGGTARAATNSITCPSTTGGSGSDCHGTLAQWKASNPTAAPAAYGFSLGSGVKGAGLLRSMTYDGVRYGFSSDAAPTVTPAPTPATKADVTGTVRDAAPGKRKVKLLFVADQLAAGTVQGDPLTYSVRVDGRPVATVVQSAGQTDQLVYKFAKKSGRHEVTVTSGGTSRTFVARTH